MDANAEQNLVDAAGRTDLAGILAALAGGASPIRAARLGGGRGLLTPCAASGRADCLRALLEAGAEPGEAGADGTTALMMAACQGKTACARLLLDAGADVDARDASGNTALIHAAGAGSVGAVALLAARGAALEAADYQRATALLNGCDAGNEAVVRALLAGGANPDARDLYGAGALAKAIFSNHEGCVLALLEGGAAQGLPPGHGIEPLELARILGRDRLAVLLEAHGRAMADHRAIESSALPGRPSRPARM